MYHYNYKVFTLCAAVTTTALCREFIQLPTVVRVKIAGVTRTLTLQGWLLTTSTPLRQLSDASSVE